MLTLDNSISISFNNVGLFSTDEKWIHPKRVIKSYEIIYVVEGRIYIDEDDKRYELKKNDVFILRPGKLHYGYEYSEGKTMFYWIHFKTENPERLLPNIGVVSNFFMYQLFKQLLHMDVINTPNYIKDIFLTYILAEYSLSNGLMSEKKSTIVENVLEYIRININATMTVKSVAEHFGYNSQSLSRMVQKYSYANLKTIISDMLLTKATDLLIHSYYTIKEIAFMLNFNSSEAFSSFFKYHKHLSPSQYRDLYSKTHMNKK